MVCRNRPSGLVKIGAMAFTSWAKLAMRTVRQWRMKPFRYVATASASERL